MYILFLRETQEEIMPLRDKHEHATVGILMDAISIHN
jgi:hypothetical protein